MKCFLKVLYMKATWSQELPQDAFYKLQDGHITRIAC